MAVQLKELLRLEVFKDFKIVAGESGLSRHIYKVGILDYEIGDVINSNFNEGEFVLTNLMLIKDDIGRMEDIVRRLIVNRTGGLAIKTLYFDKLPDPVMKMAEEAGFPIFFYDTVYYEDIITSVAEVVKLSGEMESKWMLVDQLCTDTLLPAEVKESALRLNPNFKAWMTVVNIGQAISEKTITFSPYQANRILSEQHLCLEYRGKVTLILSFDDASEKEARIRDTLHSIGIDEASRKIGISGSKALDEVNEALLEARYALEFAQSKADQSIIRFGDMGMYKFLMPLRTNKWMMQYCVNLVEPIVEYDEKNGSELLRTAQVYFEVGCDIKATAEVLFQHGNTIRYRMDRIRHILENDVKKEYVEQELAVAVRLYDLIN